MLQPERGFQAAGVGEAGRPPPVRAVTAAPELTVSIVSFAPDLPVLAAVLAHLDRAVTRAKRAGVLAGSRLLLVDNGPGAVWRRPLQDLLARPAAGFDEMALLGGHGNVGYGAGHNLAIARSRGDFHLILNPDVLVAENALGEALGFLAAHPQAGLLAPAVVDGRGQAQYLCRRYPALLDLLLRGFAPAGLKRLFRRRLARYELRDRLGDGVVWDVPLASGCFMLFRRSLLEHLQGFAPEYFLYFEDYDLSLRVAPIARIAYVPRVRITHFGGGAARKGWRHRWLFIRSAVTFFNRHGWKLF